MERNVFGRRCIERKQLKKQYVYEEMELDEAETDASLCVFLAFVVMYGKQG